MNTYLKELCDQFFINDMHKFEKPFSIFFEYKKNLNYSEAFYFGISLLNITPQLKRQITKDYTLNSKNNAYNSIMNFLNFLIFEYSHVSEWLVSKGPSLDGTLMSTKKNEVVLLIILLGCSYKKRQKDLDLEGHYAKSIHSLSKMIDTYFKTNKYYGIESFGWASYHAALEIFHVGDLNVIKHVYKDPVTLIKNKNNNSIQAYINGKHRFNHYGQYYGVNNIIDYSFDTIFEKDRKRILAHRVNPTGFVESKPTKFIQTEWDEVLSEGDYVLDIHIPENINYSIANMIKSLKEINDFYKKHFKNIRIQAFWCNSWLFSPQLNTVYNKNSNITDIWKQGFILPAKPDMKSILNYVFQTKELDFNEYHPKTTLQEKIIKYLQLGKFMNTGIWIFFLDDLERVVDHQKNPYISKEDLEKNFELFK